MAQVPDQFSIDASRIQATVKPKIQPYMDGQSAEVRPLLDQMVKAARAVYIGARMRNAEIGGREELDEPLAEYSRAKAEAERAAANAPTAVEATGAREQFRVFADVLENGMYINKSLAQLSRWS